ncbi:hypothetical protein [Synechocystis sp. LKSZ1]|uniref:hypothetical protein n=1 Tax=Synechocystis sp. LKSZ1 TaxID=3144951 RepID=UPI00336BFADD
MTTPAWVADQRMIASPPRTPSGNDSLHSSIDNPGHCGSSRVLATIREPCLLVAESKYQAE